MSKWNLQLFGLNIEGIDEDILNELNEEQPQVEEEVTEEVQEEAEVQEEVPGEADTDNKAVEQPIDDESHDEEYQESGNVPYKRFKAVNEERKTSKARIKELEEELANLRNAKPPAPPAQVVEQPQVQSDLTKEQFQRISNIARERAMKRLNLTQEDIDDMEYGDDSQKAWFNNAIMNETQNIMAEIKAHQAKEAAFAEEVAATTKEFNEYNAKFGAYSDAQARWDYISQERFNQLPKRRQDVINAAFARLQANKGTYQDMDTVSAYFELANKEWEAKQTPAPVPPVNNNVDKVKKAQALPKAPTVSGGNGGDTVYTVERIASIMNSPDGWDSLPAEIQKQILEGRLK